MVKNSKIVLAALNAKYIHSNLAVYDLEAYCKKMWKVSGSQDFKDDSSYAVSEYDSVDRADEEPALYVREFTINHNLDFILQELYREKADVYAFSCYIWNIFEILTIARELKKLLKNTEIWLGGPEVSYDAEDYLKKNLFITGIILGEGEITFYELTKFWNSELKNEQDLNRILGIAYRTEDGKIIENQKRPLMDLDELPFVYRDLEKFQNKILYYETSRGCPFSCSYCLSSIDKQVRFRSFSIVKEELDFFLEHQVPQVKFVDRTFNCNRSHALKIWDYLYENDNDVTNFHFEIAADLIGEEELSLFKKMRPGLIQLEIGLQSTNPRTIKEIRRTMDVEKVKQVLLKIRSFKNIHQHLDLIAGLPYEDFPSFKKSFHDAYEMKPDELQLGFLKVLKGSYMGEQIKNYELKYRETQPYEVLCTKWISYDEILVLKNVEEMVEVYYNSGQFRHVLSFLISFFPDAYTFYEILGNYYQKENLFGIGFKREARYQALRDFCLEFLGDQEVRAGFSEIECGHTKMKIKFWNDKELKVFDSLLTYDFYLRENAKKRPAWAKEEPIRKETYVSFFKNGGNEEISLRKNGYDPKAAARDMHIEPIVEEAYFWILHEDGEKDVEDQRSKKIEHQKMYCLFDYENRNPLTKDAKVLFMRGL